MEEQNSTIQQNAPSFQQLPAVPYSTSVLVLGILSIVICWCYGIVGIVLAIIALVQTKKAMLAYNASPGGYSLSSLNNLKAGKVCAIIGLVVSCLMLLYVIFVLVLFGAAMSA